MVTTTGRRAVAGVVVMGVVLAVAVVAVTAARDDDAGAPASSAGPGAVVERLCEARSRAGAGDMAGADASFEDAHGSLHDLAAEAAEVDRGVASRLLEAKQAVEADLAGSGAARTDLVEDLERLLSAATAALEADDLSVLPAC